MPDMNGKGITKTALNTLKKYFPDARPKLGETLEQIHRREGQQEVIQFLERQFS